MSLEAKTVYEFGPFRLDVEQHSLFRDGQLIPLTPKALGTLLLLVEKKGHLVEKDELMKRVWPDTFVESGSLAFNISALRKALGDDRLNGNRYIETVPKRGYRFIAPVVRPDLGASNAAIEEKCPAAPPLAAPRQAVSKVGNGCRIALAGATLSVAILLVYLVGRPLSPPGILGSIQLTHDGRQKGLLLADGLTLYFNEATGNGPVIAQVAISGGDTLRFPTPFETCGAFDVSARRQEMLLTGAPCGSGPWPLWTQPRLGGSPRRIGDVLAHGAAWSPDGRAIAYHREQGIYVVDADGSRSHRIATFPAHFGIPTTGPRWSPDGKVLRFKASDSQSQLNSLWEISPDGSNLHELFPGWRTTGFLGNWTPDGKYYVFSFSKDRRSDIWATRGKLSPQLGA